VDRLQPIFEEREVDQRWRKFLIAYRFYLIFIQVEFLYVETVLYDPFRQHRYSGLVSRDLLYIR
jgi:hypothetical protein